MIKNGRDLEDRMDFKFIAIVSKTIIDYNFLTSWSIPDNEVETQMPLFLLHPVVMSQKMAILLHYMQREIW